jgi:hypothetical protein
MRTLSQKVGLYDGDGWSERTAGEMGEIVDPATHEAPVGTVADARAKRHAAERHAMRGRGPLWQVRNGAACSPTITTCS